MTIHVTREHITRSQQREHRLTYQPMIHCPIAIAVQEAYPECKVYCGVIRLCVGDRTWLLPPVATEAILTYDKTHTMEPFSFDLAGAAS